MSNRVDQLLEIVDGLLDQVSALQLQLTVQQSAFLTLARHLAVRGHLDRDLLVEDIRRIGRAEDDADWQAAHAALADVLLQWRIAPSGDR